MVRTQVQLTETQSEALKRMAARRGVSVAKIIRESVDERLKHGIGPGRRRAATAGRLPLPDAVTPASATFRPATTTILMRRSEE